MHLVAADGSPSEGVHPSYLIDAVCPPLGLYPKEPAAVVAGKPVAIAMSGADCRHQLALDDQRNVLAGFIAALVVTPGVYAPANEWPDRDMPEKAAAFAGQPGAATRGVQRSQSRSISRTRPQPVSPLPTGPRRSGRLPTRPPRPAISAAPGISFRCAHGPPVCSSAPDTPNRPSTFAGLRAYSPPPR